MMQFLVFSKPIPLNTTGRNGMKSSDWDFPHDFLLEFRLTSQRWTDGQIGQASLICRRILGLRMWTCFGLPQNLSEQVWVSANYFDQKRGKPRVPAQSWATPPEFAGWFVSWKVPSGWRTGGSPSWRNRNFHMIAVVPGPSLSYPFPPKNWAAPHPALANVRSSVQRQSHPSFGRFADPAGGKLTIMKTTQFVGEARSMDWFCCENLHRKPWFLHVFTIRYRCFFCQFCHHPILWR